MSGFNPFNQRQAREIKSKIVRLKQRYPERDSRELALLVIGERSFQCALIGVLTALPAIVPGIGTLFALFGGLAADITLLTYVLTRMVLEIAALHERNLSDTTCQKEAFWAFILAAGTGTLSNNISRTIVAQLSKEAFSTLIERFLISLGIRSTGRSALLRIIPFAGLFLAGGINYWLGKTVGQQTLNYYQRKYESTEDDRNTLEAEYFFNDHD